MNATTCPCGRPLSYDNCCGRFHRGQALAGTAENLMRSRYSAFALGLTDYLLTTLHPDKHGPAERAALEQSFRDTRWEGLRILATIAGGASDASGTVEFIAHFCRRGHPGQLHERSRFVRQNDRWLYVDGDMLPAQLPGRNDPCWCGNGRKFKKCHGQ